VPGPDPQAPWQEPARPTLARRREPAGPLAGWELARLALLAQPALVRRELARRREPVRPALAQSAAARLAPVRRELARRGRRREAVRPALVRRRERAELVVARALSVSG
jgi:hypothetical protein